MREISELAREFVSRPSMNPEKIKALANLLCVFLPEKVSGAIIRLSGVLDGKEMGALIVLSMKFAEAFPQVIHRADDSATEVDPSNRTTIAS